MSVAQSELRSPEPEARAAPRFKIFSSESIGWLVGLVDLLLVVSVAVGTAALYHTAFRATDVDIQRYIAIGAVSFVNFAAIAGANGSYALHALLDRKRQIRTVVTTWAIVAAVGVSLAFAFKIGSEVSRGAIGLFVVSAPAVLLLWRQLLAGWVATALRLSALKNRSVILIADRDELLRSDTLKQMLRAGYEPAATISYRADQGSAAVSQALLEARNFAANAANGDIDSIMLLADWSDSRTITQATASLQTLPFPVHLLADRRTNGLIKGGMINVAGLAAAQLQRAPLTRVERGVKRAVDLVLASVGLVMVSPLLLAVIIAIRLSSPGSVFFVQTRNGFNGRPFRILKFRTMTVSEDGPTIQQAGRNDARVTKLGAWLRKTSIDELPQLWNVVKGDMSIVGPRPHAAAHNIEYEARIGGYAFRHHVKPGLTGWAQVQGFRGKTTVDLMKQRVDHDLYYINHWSIKLDILIILMTFRLLFRDQSAF